MKTSLTPLPSKQGRGEFVRHEIVDRIRGTKSWLDVESRSYAVRNRCLTAQRHEIVAR